MDLYRQLEIEQTADSADIKRAYFRLIRKFTPENNPDEFKKIRKAYEVLIDKDSRKAYDEELSKYTDTPPEAASVMMEAEQLLEKGLDSDAVRLLEETLKKNERNRAISIPLRLFLCDVYIDFGNTGIAAEIAQELAEEEPNNEKVLEMAAIACNERGWSNKARSYLDRLIQINPFSEDAIVRRYIDEEHSSRFFGKFVEEFEKNGKKAPMLCLHILLLSLERSGFLEDIWFEDEPEDFEEPEGFEEPESFGEPEGFDEPVFEQTSLFPDDFYDLDDEEEQEEPAEESEISILPWGNVAYASHKLAEHSEGYSVARAGFEEDEMIRMLLWSMYAADRYDILPQVEKAIKNIGTEDLFDADGYKIVSFGYTALQAIQAGIPKTVTAYAVMNAFASFDNLLDKHDVDNFRHEAVCLELEILASIWELKGGIKRLKNEFPALYNYGACFLDAAGKYNELMLMSETNRRINLLRNDDIRLNLDWLGEDDDLEIYRQQSIEPVRVTKIGRNEPCPCGSGKKYKKCCGR